MTFKTPEILVIGSNSFSGSSFINYLLDQKISCIGLSRSPELPNSFLPYKQNKNYQDFFSFFNLDLNNDLNEIVSLIDKYKFSYIVNFAAQSMVGQSWVNPEDWYQTNIISISRLVNQIKDKGFIKKYVSVTTPEVYGSTNGWIKESFNFNPSTPYAVSRASQDMHLKIYYETFNFPVVFTRAANVYGPGQSLYRIIPRAFIEALDKGKLTLDGGGLSSRSFIHIDDVSDATLKICESGVPGESYHISTDTIITIKDLVLKIASIININFDDFVAIGEDRKGKDSAYWLESSKIRNELGWKDSISLDEGLISVSKWMKENLEFLKSYPREYFHKK